MNYKILLTFLFAAILAVSAVGALNGTISAPSNVSSTATTLSIPFTLGNPNATNSVVSLAGFVTSPTGTTVSFSPSSATILPGQTISFTATLALPSSKSGTVTGTVVANDTAGAGQNVTLSFSVPIVSAGTNATNFCRAGQKGNLSISDFTIDTDGDDEETWKPLDNIQIEVEVSNDGDDDIEDVFVEIGLFDSAGRNQIGDLDFTTADEEEFDLGNIKDGKEETATFEFRVPADFDTGNYDLKVKAYSDDKGESNECVDTSSDLDDTTHQNIDVESEDDEGKFIAFDNIEFNPTEATCGDTVTLSFDVFNVGEDDEDRVRINVESRDFKITQSEEITNGLDQGDSDNMLFTFTVPQGLTDKLYTVELSADYDYRNGVYREESEDSDKYALRVFGCGIGTGTNTGTGSGTGTGVVASISAALASEAEAGEELVVVATITNRQSSEASFVVDAEGYDSWAELASISDRLVTLSPGESEEVTFTFEVEDDASGQQTFTITTQSGGSTTEKDVVVELAESNGFSFGGNGLIWAIIIVNVVLLIAIILVAVRLARD